MNSWPGLYSLAAVGFGQKITHNALGTVCQEESFAHGARMSFDGSYISSAKSGVHDLIPPMTKYLETKISEVADDQFHSMVHGLCHCLNIVKSEIADETLRFLLMSINREDPKCLSESYLPAPGVLTAKVDALPSDSVVYQVCVELVQLNHGHIESFDGKKVLSLIRQCSKVLCPQRRRAKSLTKNQLRHSSQTELIMQRRRYGML